MKIKMVLVGIAAGLLLPLAAANAGAVFDPGLSQAGAGTDLGRGAAPIAENFWKSVHEDCDKDDHNCKRCDKDDHDRKCDKSPSKDHDDCDKDDHHRRCDNDDHKVKCDKDDHGKCDKDDHKKDK